MTDITWVKNQDGANGISWNPYTGCVKKSSGCDNCYAEEVARRFNGGDFTPTFHPERMNHPKRLIKPRGIFCGSMTDLFQPAVSDANIEDIIFVMRDTPQHRYMILTKRPERMSRFAFPDNVWAGVSVESGSHANRIAWLDEIEAEHVFVSFEPLIESCAVSVPLSLSVLDRHLDWAIIGGESGRGARTMKAEWVRDLIEVLEDYRVPVFFKQHGGFPNPHVSCEFEGKVYDAIPYWDGVKVGVAA